MLGDVMVLPTVDLITENLTHYVLDTLCDFNHIEYIVLDFSVFKSRLTSWGHDEIGALEVMLTFTCHLPYIYDMVSAVMNECLITYDYAKALVLAYKETLYKDIRRLCIEDPLPIKVSDITVLVCFERNEHGGYVNRDVRH